MCGTKPHGEVSRDAHGKPDEDDKTPQPFWGIPRHSSVEELLNLLVHDLSIAKFCHSQLFEISER